MWVHRSLISFLKVLAEKKAEETTMRKRKLVEEPNSPSRPRPYRAKIETSSEAFSNQKPLKKNQRNREGETQREYQDTPVFYASDVQEQDSKLEHSLLELVVPPLQHSNPPPPKEPGSSGFFGFLRHLHSAPPDYNNNNTKVLRGGLIAFNVTVRSDCHGTCQGSHVAQACVGHCESSAFPSRYSVLVASGYRHNVTSISQCCTISRLKKVKVWLDCVGNQQGELEIFTARACQCDMCRLSRY
ncbi:Glycoprotein hormone alpha-2 [Microtus ochrogaster]|uniref:Glycoprotein hormone alpha-2 n=1 Tax=Microtus ochrogaster TaxID=79684 RepID=A0A8J6GBR9_MICOH|nr:Glycoprotein hormone alpha-2 [Microtus ochrogaster]